MSRAGDRGQATVESAVVLPVIAVLMALIVQVGLVVRDHVLVVHAAREAVRAAAVATADERLDAARRGGAGAGPLDPDHLQVTQELLAGGDRLRVGVQYLSRTDLPIIGALLPDVELTADATMSLENTR